MRRIPHSLLAWPLALVLAATTGLALGATGAGAAGSALGDVPTAVSTQTKPDLPVTVENADGSTTTVTDVSRIIPLNGDIAEVVFALGLGDNLVATDVSATFPAGAAATPKVGYQRTLSAEAILAFEPTVVIGNTDAGPPPVIEQLRGAGVAVVIIETEPSVESAPDKIRLVAEALGVPERGDEIATKTTRSIARARRLARRADERPRVVFLYVRGTNTQLIAGKGTGVDSMLRAARATDAALAAGIEGFVPVTAEALVAAAPDVIIVTTGGLESVGGIDGLLAIPGIAQTPAGKDRRIIDYDDQRFLGGGPRSGAALRALVLDLHPELA